MRHHQKRRTLGRTKRGRTALLRSLARSLVIEEGIVTSVAKAKELRPFVERLVTASKSKTLQSQRYLESRLGAKSDALRKLHVTLSERFKDRTGGYTRIVRLGRLGKQTGESARIEFVQ